MAAAAVGTVADVGGAGGTEAGAGVVIGVGQGSALVFIHTTDITVIPPLTPTRLILIITPIRATLLLPQ